MNLSDLFNWNRSPSLPNDELPNIFPMSISQTDFIRMDITSIYAKILTDVLERSHGLNDDQLALMWDNCVMSNSNDGLITRLAHAMADRRDLFLVYEEAVNVVRAATQEEAAQIEKDYKAQGESDVGVYVSFKNLTRSDMIKFYIALEYLTVGSLHKTMNISKAVQIKISDLRASVSLSEQDHAKAQAQSIAKALGSGKDVLLDAKDTIETSVPDLTAIQSSIDFLVKKLSFYLGMPDSYLKGEQTSGMGSTGENDMRAVERGLKSYYFGIMKPVLEALFDVSLTYKSQDFRQIEGSMDVLKTFSLIDEALLSLEQKKLVIGRMLDLPESGQA